ncbi:MAG: glycosyltransferase [Chloroflexi bacterium]|nr:glycosyltransferase [Chloroflexota bacterium]
MARQASARIAGTANALASSGRRLRLGLALRSSTAWAGGHHYVLSWIDALAALPEPERPEVFLLWTTAEARVDAEARAADVTGHAHLAEAARLGIDFVFPVKEIPEAPSGVPWGGWIVDWQQRHLPAMFDASEHVMRELRYRVMLDAAPVVAHSSDQARQDTLRWVPEGTAVPAVLHFRATLDPDTLADDPQAARQRYGLPPRYAIVCNQWYRHKNHPIVVEALGLLRARGISIPCVFTGRAEDHRWPDYGPSIERRVADLGLEDTVRLVGSVPRVDQVLLVRAAALVIQPSFFEGWSTIVEEGRALGKPMLLSDIPVHREQSPPDSRFFDPHDPAALADALELVWGAGASADPVRERAALGEHARLRAEAGRALLALAQEGITRFDPDRHDPARVLTCLMREAAHLGPEGGRTRDFVTEAVRVWFSHHPWRLPGFAADVLESDAPVRAWARSAILPALARHATAAWRAADEEDTCRPVWWDPAVIDVVRDLASLTGAPSVSVS